MVGYYKFVFPPANIFLPPRLIIPRCVRKDSEDYGEDKVVYNIKENKSPPGKKIEDSVRTECTVSQVTRRVKPSKFLREPKGK